MCILHSKMHFLRKRFIYTLNPPPKFGYHLPPPCTIAAQWKRTREHIHCQITLLTERPNDSGKRAAAADQQSGLQSCACCLLVLSVRSRPVVPWQQPGGPSRGAAQDWAQSCTQALLVSAQGNNRGTLGMVVFHTSFLSQMPCAVLLRYPSRKCILGFCAKACSKEQSKNLGMQSQESSETNCLIFPVNLVWQLQIVLWMN